MSDIQLSINLNFNQLLEAVKQLSPKQKSILNSAIWDEIMEIPIEHQALVLQRKEGSIQTPENMIDWDEASKTLVS